jgi:zinc protease
MKSVAIAFRIFTACIASSVAFSACAQTPLPGGIERVTSVEGITEYRLSNGLRVLLFPDPSKATITVNVTYLVGSVHESYGETGMAHLLEHLLFKGSEQHPDILADLRNHGAQFNGSTSWDRTNYFETFDASDENLQWALGLEADRMVRSFVAQKDLDSEMTVVRNEFEAGENNPSRVLFERVLSTAYVWHGYGNSPIGSRSDIENVPIERLQAFYRKYYQPDNAVLVVAGRIDEAATLELIDEHFGSIPRPARVLEDNYTAEPTQDGEREVVVRRVGDIQLLAAGYHASAGAHPDFVPLQIAARVLTDEPSGRLYKALVATGLAAQVAAQSLQLRDPGLLLLLAIVRQDGSLELARETFFATIDELTTNPITAEEVERAKNRVLSGLEQQMNNSQAIAIQLSSWASIGDWRLLFLDRDRVRAVTADDVQRVALQYLKPSNRTVGLFIPGEPDRTEIPERPDLMAMLDGYAGDEARSQGEAFDPAPANIDARTTRVDLPGGVKLAMLPKETRGDAVNATIRLNFGDERSLAGYARIAPLAMQMLMRGTVQKPRQAIQDELARRQSRLNVGGGAGAVTANIQTTNEHLTAVLELAIEVLREPAFPEDELETLRSAALAGIEASRSEPQAIAQRAFGRHFAQNYEMSDVRYVPTVEEEIAMLRGASAAALREFHAAFVGASNAEVVVVGDFDPNAVRELLTERLSSWRSPKPYTEVQVSYPEPALDPLSEIFETPDKENAFFLAGMPIKMTDEHPDYPALVLGNYILGQGASSRLFSRIRGREGLSYGVGSQFQAAARADGARFAVNAISAPQNSARVEAAFRDELTIVLRDGYSDEELATAKQSWSQGRQVARSQDGALTGMLLGATHNGRTMAWDAELEARVRALTADDVQAAMRRHLDLERMTFIKSGDFAAGAD